MTWNYRLGKKGDCYYVYEYINDSLCEPENVIYTSDPGQYKCIRCKGFWFQTSATPNCSTGGDSWTEDPIVTNCYESKEDAIEDLERMVEDVKREDIFDYE